MYNRTERTEAMQSGEKFERQLRSFSMLAGCGCMCTDDGLSVGYSENSCSFSCPAKGGIESSSGDEGCIWSHRRAAYGAEKFGGKYIYFCPAGFIFCIAKYAGKTESGYLLAGPMNVSENADFVPGDASGEIDLSRIDRAQFLAFQRTVPYVDSQKVSAVSDMLQALAL